MRLTSPCLVGALCLVAPASVFAQGLLVPQQRAVRTAGSYKLSDLEVEATVRDQVAAVQVSQTFQNTSSRTLEVQFVFPMVDGSALKSFTLMVDGKEVPGRLLKRDEARRIYEEIVRSRRDPALLEYMGRDALQTSIFPLPAGAERRVVLHYNQICRRDGELVEFAFPLSTAKHAAGTVDRLRVQVRIHGQGPLGSVYSPTHDVEITRPQKQTAVVTHEAHRTVAADDFRLFYHETEQDVGATLLSYRPNPKEPGYFLLLASPEVPSADRTPVAKTVVFVVDRSGSMTGKKLEQAKEAARFVLNNLNEGDTFNLIAYESSVETFRPELERYNDDTRREALGFVDGLFAGGSTDIDAALRTALAMIQDDTRPSYVLFLTDGLPTAGETREPAIVENATAANPLDARLFAFGVGYDVNARLLQKLVRANHGITEFVRPNEDLEAAVSRFYAKVGSPALTDLEIELAGVSINRSYPKELPDLFHGGQLVWVGRYAKPGETTIHLEGKVGKERKQYAFGGTLAEASRNATYGFVEKLWAVRRVGEILDMLDLKGHNQELVDELVALSTRHGILSPYTAFLADETTDLAAGASNSVVTRRELRSQSGYVTGRAGVEQRRTSQRSQDESNSVRLGAPVYTPRSRRGVRGLKRGAVVVQDIEGRARVAQTVQNVGQKTFFYRDGGWIDSTLVRRGARELARATVLEQYSDEFFAQLRSQSAEENQYFTFDEPVTLALGGKLYRIVPPR